MLACPDYTLYVAMIMNPRGAQRAESAMAKRISGETLKQMMGSETDFVLIDARGHEAYAKEHIPGAVSVPSDHIGEHLIRDFGKDRTYVTYCSGWSCEASTVAAAKLDKFGFKKVLEYKGGLEDWKAAGLPTEKGA